MSLDALRVATLGLFPLSPIAAAMQGLLAVEEEEPAAPPGGGGRTGAPWRWVHFIPVRPRRPRKRRQADILFMH